MGNCTIFWMFENPRKGRQARNFTTNVPKNSRCQIVFRTDIFQKLTLAAPDFKHIAFFFTLFEGYKCNKLYEITPKKRFLLEPEKTNFKSFKFHYMKSYA